MSVASLAIDAAFDAARAVTGFDSIGDAASAMGREVARAGDVVGEGASRIDRAAESADGLASRSSQAAGGLGDLGGALSMLPGPLGSLGSGMEAMAPIIMGVTGAADLLNLALSTQALGWVKTTAATTAHAVAAKATAVAQWALNAAMSANPIALVIIAIVALVAIFVLAYKKVGWFRDGVNAAMSGVKVVVGFVINLVVGYFRLWWTVVSTVGGFILGKVGEVVGFIRGIPGKVKSALSGNALFEAGKDLILGLINGIKAMAGRAISAVTDVVGGAVSKAKGLLGIASPSKVFRKFGVFTVDGLVQGIRRNVSKARRAAGALASGVISGFGGPSLALDGPSLGGGGGPRGGGTVVINNNTTINGAVDKTGTARDLKQLLKRRARRIGD